MGVAAGFWLEGSLWGVPDAIQNRPVTLTTRFLILKFHVEVCSGGFLFRDLLTLH